MKSRDNIVDGNYFLILLISSYLSYVKNSNDVLCFSFLLVSLTVILLLLKIPYFLLSDSFYLGVDNKLTL